MKVRVVDASSRHQLKDRRLKKLSLRVRALDRLSPSSCKPVQLACFWAGSPGRVLQVAWKLRPSGDQSFKVQPHSLYATTSKPAFQVGLMEESTQSEVLSQAVVFGQSPDPGPSGRSALWEAARTAPAWCLRLIVKPMVRHMFSEGIRSELCDCSSIVLQASRKPLMAATSTVSTKRCKRQGEDNDHWPVLIVSRCWAVFAGLLAAGQAVFAR